MTSLPYPEAAVSGRRVLPGHVPTFSVPEGLVARLVSPLSFRWFTSKRLLHLSVAVLVTGIMVSIVTTTDQTWWQSMFSALGTFDDFSGYVFNVTLFLAGAGITIVGFRVAAELRRISARRARKRSGMLTILVVSAGIHLAGVGLMPVNVNQFLHERAASGVMLSFLCILATTASARRHIPPQLVRATWIVAAVLVAAIALFVTGVINLALFELAGFGLIFVWLHVMTHSLGRALMTPQQQQLRHERRDVVARGTRARVSRPTRAAARPAPAPAQRHDATTGASTARHQVRPTTTRRVHAAPRLHHAGTAPVDGRSPAAPRGPGMSRYDRREHERILEYAS